jgi:hypothetical protein
MINSFPKIIETLRKMTNSLRKIIETLRKFSKSAQNAAFFRIKAFLPRGKTVFTLKKSFFPG